MNIAIYQIYQILPLIGTKISILGFSLSQQATFSGDKTKWEWDFSEAVLSRELEVRILRWSKLPQTILSINRRFCFTPGYRVLLVWKYRTVKLSVFAMMKEAPSYMQESNPWTPSYWVGRAAVIPWFLSYLYFSDFTLKTKRDHWKLQDSSQRSYNFCVHQYSWMRKSVWRYLSFMAAVDMFSSEVMGKSILQPQTNYSSIALRCQLSLHLAQNLYCYPHRWNLNVFLAEAPCLHHLWLVNSNHF